MGQKSHNHHYWMTGSAFFAQWKNRSCNIHWKLFKIFVNINWKSFQNLHIQSSIDLLHLFRSVKEQIMKHSLKTFSKPPRNIHWKPFQNFHIQPPIGLFRPSRSVRKRSWNIHWKPLRSLREHPLKASSKPPHTTTNWPAPPFPASGKTGHETLTEGLFGAFANHQLRASLKPPRTTSWRSHWGLHKDRPKAYHFHVRLERPGGPKTLQQDPIWSPWSPAMDLPPPMSRLGGPGRPKTFITD